MRSSPFTCLIDQLLDMHATANIEQKTSVFSNIKVIAIIYAYYCSMPKDGSTFIVAEYCAV